MIDDKKPPFDKCPICGGEIKEINGKFVCIESNHTYEEMLKEYYEQRVKEKEGSFSSSQTVATLASPLNQRGKINSQSSNIDIIIATLLLLGFLIVHESLKLNIVPILESMAIFLMFLIGVIWKFYHIHHLNRV